MICPQCQHPHRPIEATDPQHCRNCGTLWNAFTSRPVLVCIPSQAISHPALRDACRDALAIVDEAYEATGYIKVARTSKQRLKIEAVLTLTQGD